ncbi:insulinase family protein [Clostridium estertheticum]|uniref:M16 family metallopeptidase n=1 Tax=Clostridium estertheticum TaxID=238834 RepID=UPI001CF49DA0|nr:pitrilysin family protein [Clostridium estertheticum]MCB2305862.1 insulinase family protein [Clostridium estertheticum]MCB2345669.1 insulinase family protein [Clostridium estertheticum]MCB2349166.1 insulinase family protein [Clostridium estertheticum]WAG47798.1 insulinase family protein [Clostridium estertheticum]
MIKEIFNTKQTELSNGIKLITIKKDSQISAVHAGVNIGSLFEEKDEKGIAHFIEHMLFKGTQVRTNEELNSDLENLGGEYNAYTDFNSTVYSATVLNEELENAITLMGDMLLNSTFPIGEIEKERGVILSEIRTINDDIEDLSFQRVNEIAFKYSPLREDTIGNEDIIKNVTRKQLVDFYNKYYLPNNSFISIVSPLEHEDIINIVNKCFGNWTRKKFDKKKIVTEKQQFIKKISYKKEIEQSTILYLYTFNGLSKDEELALRILNYKFGESSNSILFRELREERGLSYDVYTHLDTSNNVKTLYIYTSVSEKNVDEAIHVIDTVIKDIETEKIVFDDNTISLMKKIMKTAIASTLEDSTDLSNYVLHQAMDNEDIYQFTDDMKNMGNVKSEDLYNVSRKVLQKPTIHIFLPEKRG